MKYSTVLRSQTVHWLQRQHFHIRYITDRFLPDKAIDLVDEACALIKTELDSMPTELDELRRKIMQLEIEEAALKKETDKLEPVSVWKHLQKELAELRDTVQQPEGTVGQ